MTLEIIKKAIMDIIPLYPIKRVVLFGSRASGKNQDNSDIDLIMEFSVFRADFAFDTFGNQNPLGRCSWN